MMPTDLQETLILMDRQEGILTLMDHQEGILIHMDRQEGILTPMDLLGGVATTMITTSVCMREKALFLNVPRGIEV